MQEHEVADRFFFFLSPPLLELQIVASRMESIKINISNAKQF